MARVPFRYHKSTVAVWACLGAVMIATSIAAIAYVGFDGLFLIVMGWIAGPFVLYWMYKKIRAVVKRQ
jgi:hypothetical protein